MKFKLSDICDIKIGRTPPRKESQWFNTGLYSDYTWVSIKDLGECNKYIDFSSETISLDGQEKFNIPVAKTGTILLSFKLTVGRVAIATKNLLTNEAIAQLPIKDSSKVDRDFLYYYLLRYPWSTLGSTSSIATAINSKMIKEMEVELPDILMQRKIANILSTFDEKINTNYDINNNLEQQAKAIFSNEFLTLETLPDGWDQASLIDIADYLNGLAMQKYRPTADETGIPVLKIKELRQTCCDDNSELCSPNIKSEYIIQDGDVIFSWSGSLLVDFWCGGICGLNQHLFKVTSNKYNKWFYYAWTKHHLDRFIVVAADKATTMGHIKRDELAKAKVIIPNEADYQRIGALLQPIYDLIISNRIENKKLSSLRDILLPKLISGELDVSNIDF